MSLNTKPTLSTIAAFDAEFGQEGKENLSPPVLKFSWKDGMARKNRVVIRDYDSAEVVYDCTITTMALKHQLHNLNDTTDKVQPVAYNLQNGHKYIANVYVYTETNGDPSLASNDVIFYCFSEPTFRFINFTDYIGNADTDVAIVENNSVNLQVEYKQENGEVLNNYNFILKDYTGTTLLTSDTKYSSLSNDILRYTLGGVQETGTDQYGNILPNRYYTIICSGETSHGIVVYAEQKFVVHVDNSGVGALISVKNIGDGNVSITSNYKIMNAQCSVDDPTFELDENGEPYAINLIHGETVEFLDGFILKDPYEIVATGYFNLGELIHLTNADGIEASINFCKYTYTATDLYYFNVYVTNGNVTYEVRTNYFTLNRCEVKNGTLVINGDYTVTEDGTLIADDFTISGGAIKFQDDQQFIKLDISYRNGLFNIKAQINEEVY